MGPFGTRFNYPEFFLGLVVGLFLYWLIRRAISAVALAKTGGKAASHMVRRYFSSAGAEPFKQELALFLDKQHLADPLFALREILITPHVLIPPPPHNPADIEEHRDLYHSILPSTSDQNMLASIYGSPSIPCDRLLAFDHPILLTGIPGSGKTCALAFLAFACLAPKQSTEDEQTPPPSPLPVYLHAADLDLQKEQKDPFDRAIEAAQRLASVRVAPIIPSYLRHHLNQGQILLLIDGMDSMCASEIQRIAAWIRQVRQSHPECKIIAAGPSRGFDGLLSVGFTALPMTPWDQHMRHALLENWARAWQKYVLASLPQKRPQDIDPLLLNTWTEVSIQTASPFFFTLQVWGAYVGDVRKVNALASIHPYLLRILSRDEIASASELGRKWILNGEGTLQPGNVPEGALTHDLVQAGLLQRHAKGRLGFRVPALGSFLAAEAMREQDVLKALQAPGWGPARMALELRTGLTDASQQASRALQSDTAPLHGALLSAGSWLRYAPPTAKWRNSVLGSLAKLIKEDDHPYGLRLRALEHLVSANEKSVGILFKRMLQSDHEESVVLGALGLGALHEEGHLPEFNALLQSGKSQAVRFAACIALAAIGTSKAMELLGRLLLQGEEEDRFFAAQALAIDSMEGFAMLKDALEMPSVSTRRAAVYGLGRLWTEEAHQILDELLIEDSQYIVKNAASEMLEQQLIWKDQLIDPSKSLASLEWLIQFAAEQGLGVSPGKGAIEMVRRALLRGTPTQKLAALEAVGTHRIEGLVMDVYELMQDQNPEIRRGTYETLDRLDASGAKLPPLPSKQKEENPASSPKPKPPPAPRE